MATKAMERQQDLAELDKMKVDPGRLWSNASTGNKVLAAVSLAIGGFLSTKFGRKNTALDIIQKA